MRRLEDKLAHITAALDGKSEVASSERRGALALEQLRFYPSALPECDLDAIDTTLTLLKKPIAAPVMVSPMTGGLAQGGELNRRMARVAEHLQLPFGVGSQRVALEVSSRAKDFQVREVAPTIPLFANMGAVQLAKGYGPTDLMRAVDMIGADALYLHLNAMQEVVQEGGDLQWTGVLSQISHACEVFAKKRPSTPIFVREVGFGLTATDTRRLLDAGVSGVDCAGGGGLSWSLLEGRVAASERHQRLGRVFAQWGLTTPESVLEVRKATKDICLIASGGVRTGLDVMRLVALGANLAGMASPVLRAAEESEEACLHFLQTILLEIRATMFGTGCRNLQQFQSNAKFLPLRHLPQEIVAI